MTEIARTRLLGVALKAFVASLAVFTAACAARAATCESLATLALPDTTIVLAKLEPAGVELHLPGPPLGNLRAFCRVGGEIKPTKDSNIKFEVWMPASGWNHKLMGIGNGGWSGEIWYTDMSDALQRGYATASTDTGHEGSAGDASFALGHPEKVIDFGYRAFHETTVKAKAILSAYYGDAPKHSYWNGCSTGGKQGLTEAQRFPRDYDGIIAGAPANFWTHLMPMNKRMELCTLLDSTVDASLSHLRKPWLTVALQQMALRYNLGSGRAGESAGPHRPILTFLMMFVFGFTLYATTVLLPQLLQSLMGYTAELSGYAMSSGGLATIICMPIVGFLISRLDGRYLIMFGFTAMALALFYMTSLDLQMSFAYAAKLRFLQSIALAFLFVPINTMIYVGVPPGKNNDVSGLSNLARNVGGSAGTSFFTTVLARHQQVHQQYLVQHVQAGSPAYLRQAGSLTRHLLTSAAAVADAQTKAVLMIYRSVQAQASVLSYIDVLESLTIICACMIPLVLLMKRPPKGAQAAVH